MKYKSKHNMLCVTQVQAKFHSYIYRHMSLRYIRTNIRSQQQMKNATSWQTLCKKNKMKRKTFVSIRVC